MYNKTIFKTVSLKCNVKSMTGSKSHINSFITWWKKIIKLMTIIRHYFFKWFLFRHYFFTISSMAESLEASKYG
jgi:hypothetical protein